jgi:hypothetical protein
MPALSYGKTAYRRDNGDLPEQKLQNLLIEATPTDDDGVALLARAGLEEHSTPGSSGAVKGIYSKAGLFSGDIFSVVGSSLYRGETLVDTVDGSGPISFADNGVDELAVNAGGDIEVYDGATLTAATFPDSADVVRIGFVSGLYVAARKNTGKFYWSATLDATSWNALDFATAESQADNLLDLVVIGDVVWLLGQESIEAWDITGDADLPFRKVIGRSYQVGLIATGAAVNLKGRLCWVGNDARPYMDGQPIADEGLAERIRAGTTISCFEFTYEGHPIFCVRIEGGTSEGTWGFDLTTGSWLEFTSYERVNWRVRTAFTKGATVYLGDDELNTIWTFGGGSENGDPIQCVFSAVVPVANALQVDNIGMFANFGRSESLSGDGSDPYVEMRLSRNEGNSWTDWRPKSLGLMGEYRKRVRWNRCGMIDAPCGIFEFRSTDVTRLRVSGLTINEPGGGRGRQ